ncbi:SPP-like hydrolase [Ignisphaera aggregans DSM 17230]|uniref:Phosphoglycolate phosphatase n=1 Tax=Ignisphaera aggregans (strain DSM 17230 / JCM 13409 / AQ1.S1) TaxID=583356 RepID=E0SRH7_IGNAA|nr:SPP-like hydrolase [Ignisphaera aggregans DSM 17230]
MIAINNIDDLINYILKKFNNSKPTLIATDLDGTLTIDRNSYRLDLEAMEILRELNTMGISICIASAADFQTVSAISKYIVSSNIFIAENGCIAFDGYSIIEIAKRSTDDIVKEILERFALKEPLNNRFRLYDKALLIPSNIDPKEIEGIARYIEDRYPYVKVRYSGYALHITPKECSKGRALEVLAIRRGIDLSRAIAIGDSEVDIDMLKAVGIGIAVGDADEKLKKIADVVIDQKASSASKILFKAIKSILSLI